MDWLGDLAIRELDLRKERDEPRIRQHLQGVFYLAGAPTALYSTELPGLLCRDDPRFGY